MFSRQSIVALQHRNFRLIWIGLLLSFTGSFMQNAALLWHVSLVVSPDRKGLALGAVGLARIVPVVAFSLVAGVVADALDRRRVLIVTQTLAGVVALVLAIITFREVTALWPIYALAAAGGAVSTFDLPARQALLPTLVPREHLPNAITLMTIMFQVASVIGPALAGVVIAATSVGWVYMFNALSFCFVILALVVMRDVPVRAPSASGSRDNLSIRAAAEGLRFVFQSRLIRSTMLLDFFVTFFASATALLPIFAQDILFVDARGYGWLFAAPAVGAVVTSVALVPLVQHIDRQGAAILWSVVAHGVFTVVFGISTSFWLMFFCLAITGAADTVSTVVRNVIRQLETPDRLRGRMTGVNMVFFIGGPQLGELEAGIVANWFGAPFSVISGGIGCLIATAWISASTPLLRRHRATSTASEPRQVGTPS